MPEIQKYSLTEELRKADESLQGSPSLLGMTMLTYPNYINSMRSTMFTSHLKQFLNLLKPEFPYVFTNNENLVGKYSSGYEKTDHRLRVYKKICKFEDLIDRPLIYKLFVFDEETQTFDVIERTVCENLTENFGYEYINDVIDSFNEGDIIEEDTVLYRSTSYDEDMNYAYGRNVPVIYTLDPYTSEDAAVAAESLCEEYASIESDEVTIGLNTNEYLINKFGNKENYKPLPDIGEVVDNILGVSRTQFNNQLLFDFKESSLRTILDGDKVWHIESGVHIIDYSIKLNEEEMPDTPFYNHIKKYYDAEIEYYHQILDCCTEIINSGYEYSREVDYLYKRVNEALDSAKKWKDDDSIFSGMKITVKFYRKAPLAKGSKITGRYGNKSVISRIVKDEDMPYTHDGRRAKLMLSLLGLVNRTTSFPLYEIFINGSGYQVRQKMKTLDTFQEKENMLFTFVRVWNEEQEAKMYTNYKKKTKKEKEAYIQDAIDNGIYIHYLPMWETVPVFYRCANLLKAFPFIKPDDLYIQKWGREYKILTKYFFGEMYIMKLKQSDRRGFSARSTGALDTKGLPTRSFKSKSHLERTSSSCIRFGEFETLNFSIAILPEDIALFHALYRTSIKGRKDLISMMFSNTTDGIIKIDSSYTSRVAEIFNVILKSLGIQIDFIDEDEEVKVLNDDILSQHELDGRVYFCTDYQFFMIERMDSIRKEILEVNPVLTEDKLKEMIEHEMKTRKYINGSINDDIGEIELLASKEIAEEFKRQQEAKRIAKEMEEESKAIAETLEEVTSE